MAQVIQVDSPNMEKRHREWRVYLGVSNTSAIIGVEGEITPMWIHEMAKQMGFRFFASERTWLTHDLSRVHLISSRLKGIATPLKGRDIPTALGIIVVVFAIEQPEISEDEIALYLRKLAKFTFRDIVLKIPDPENPTWLVFFKTKERKRKPLRVRVI
jgi:hypothetical protein